MAVAIIIVWFPSRFVAELLKAVDLSEKPDHTAEARELFRQAYSLSRDLTSKNDFADPVLRHVQLPPSLHDAFFDSLRSFYAGNMMLEVPPIPANLDNLDGIRWRDRMRREIGRMNEASHIAVRKACLAAIEATVADLPKIVGDGEIASPLSTLVNPGKFVEDLVRPVDASLFPALTDRYEENVYRIFGITRARYDSRRSSPSRTTSTTPRHSSTARPSPAFWRRRSARTSRNISATSTIGSSPAAARARPPRCTTSSPKTWSAPCAASAQSSSSTASTS